MFSRLIRLGSEPEPGGKPPAPGETPNPKPAAAEATAPAGEGNPGDRPGMPEDPPADSLEFKIIEAIRTCYDPEIPVNILDLGLIYGVGVDENNHAKVVMTLTTPNCPAAQSLPGEVQTKVAAIDGISSAEIDLTFDPPWDMSKMSEAAKLELGFF